MIASATEPTLPLIPLGQSKAGQASMGQASMGQAKGPTTGHPTRRKKALTALTLRFSRKMGKQSGGLRLAKFRETLKTIHLSPSRKDTFAFGAHSFTSRERAFGASTETADPCSGARSPSTRCFLLPPCWC